MSPNDMTPKYNHNSSYGVIVINRREWEQNSSKIIYCEQTETGSRAGVHNGNGYGKLVYVFH